MASHAKNIERRAAAIEALTALPGGTVSDDKKLRLKRLETLDLELLELMVAVLAAINSRIA